MIQYKILTTNRITKKNYVIKNITYDTFEEAYDMLMRLQKTENSLFEYKIIEVI